MSEKANRPFKTSIGGQALIEGLMMIGPKKRAMAVRKPDGEILLEYLPVPKSWKIETWPVVRGSVKLLRQMSVGMKALFRSADLAEEEEKQGDEEEKKGFLDRHPNLFMAITTVISLSFAVLLFGLLPNGITDIIRRVFKLADPMSFSRQIGLNLIEGLIRILIFVGYLALTRKSKQMRRVWMYHGAEHKTIACYEAREELLVENVRKFSRLHPRCGTSFLFLVMMVSILVLSFTGWHRPLMNLALRLLLLPLIAGLSYELILWTGRHDNTVSSLLRKPGLALQNLTTSEPEDAMLEVSIQAMLAVVPEDESDQW